MQQETTQIPLIVWIQDAGGRNYRILAPPNVAASIKASAPQLNLEDQNGNNVDQTAPIANFAAGLAAPVAGADNTQFLRFTVRKKN